MKVLFAVNNENISTLIVKKYQKEYKEIISCKNVYYFNAILKELQKDKTYDRIVISEDLEKFTNSNYQQMDKFIFDRLDSISDEASNLQGENIPIILICSERRTKGEDILVKLFGIGVYDAVIGKDRDITEVCNLINRPRSKKEAKEYYRIDAEDVNYQAESENDVSEIEIQNILAHYKRIGKNEDKYVESFDNIALQYNDTQLKIICRFLPLNVRAVLEEQSLKYQTLMSYNKSVSKALKGKDKTLTQSGTSEKLLITPNSKPPLTRPVVIPSGVKSGEARKLTKTEKTVETPRYEQQETVQKLQRKVENEPEIRNEEKEEIVPVQEEAPKRGRGRPKKVLTEEEKLALEEKSKQPKRGRGRPKKQAEEISTLPQIDEEDDEIDSILPGFEEIEPESKLRNNSRIEEEEQILPGFEEDYEDEEENDDILQGFEEDEEDDGILPEFNHEDEEDMFNQKGEEINSNFELPGIEIDEEDEEDLKSDFYNQIRPEQTYNQEKRERPMSLAKQQEYANVDISGLLTRDKKIVTFVGTSKNGTSFVLNNLAQLLSSQGINVAILDATQNRNAYFIYTKNEEELRKIAFNSLKNLTSGIANGIRVNNNLTVYTSLPSEENEIEQVGPILETLLKNHSLILIDCDFKTPLDYFANSQEMYLVQSMDVLTIQPLTAFLRELKAKNILDENKIRIIINKYIKLRNVTEKAIIGGIAYYNDPAMSFMTELFDRNTVKYFTMQFEEDIYAKYLEGLINCDISLRGYSKTFMQTLKQLGNSVFPLISGKTPYEPPQARYQPPTAFNANMNNTLNQMKRNY